jgi:hypothetical protein
MRTRLVAALILGLGIAGNCSGADDAHQFHQPNASGVQNAHQFPSPRSQVFHPNVAPQAQQFHPSTTPQTQEFHPSVRTRTQQFHSNARQPVQQFQPSVTPQVQQFHPNPTSPTQTFGPMGKQGAREFHRPFPTTDSKKQQGLNTGKFDRHHGWNNNRHDNHLQVSHQWGGSVTYPYYGYPYNGYPYYAYPYTTYSYPAVPYTNPNVFFICYTQDQVDEDRVHILCPYRIGWYSTLSEYNSPEYHQGYRPEFLCPRYGASQYIEFGTIREATDWRNQNCDQWIDLESREDY